MEIELLKGSESLGKEQIQAEASCFS
jgi:hypothetical protein